MNRIARAICIVTGVVVGLPLVLYVGHGLAATIDLRAARGQAVEELDAGLPAARQESERAQTVLRQRVPGAGRPAYSWQEVDCELDSIDAGWIVQDYEQSCGVRTVDVYAAGDRVADDGTCDVVPSAALVPTRRPDVPCSYVLPALEADRVRVLAGERPSDVPAGEQWLLVQSQAEVSRTTIGCSPWGLVFCSAPSGFPVMTTG